MVKPWGFELWWAETDLYAGKVLHVEQGHRLSLQYHRRKDESCYLLSGRIRLVTGLSVDELETVELDPAACWRNRPGQIHTVEAIETSEILEVSTPHLDDVVRLLDDYGRTGDAGARPAEPPDEAGPMRLLDKDQVAAKLGLRREQIRTMMAEEGFPRPIAYFRGRILWDEGAFEAYQAGASDDQELQVSA